jgi:ribosomal protein S12 methylthiotransferase accessory factor
MLINVTFPGVKRVDATFGRHVVHTDQSVEHGGEGAAPEPYEVFLASLATCAGAYLLAFCDARGLSAREVELIERAEFDANHRLESVEIELVLPPSFPEKYRTAVARAVEGCKVKKTLATPPAVTVSTRIPDAGPGDSDAGEAAAGEAAAGDVRAG